MSELFDKIFDQIQEFLELDSENLKRAEELSKKIIRNSEEVGKSIGDRDRKEDFLKILSGLKNYSSKLSEDITNSKETSLKSEWGRLASQDMFRLKDEIMALQEFLQANETEIRRNLEKERYGFDARDLFRRLKTDSSIDKVIRSKISNLLDKLSEEEIRERIERNKDRLSRISNWFLMRKEVQNASE